MRINDLARELEVKSKAILEFLPTIGVEVKSHSSRLEEDQVRKVKGHFGGVKSSPAPAAEPPRKAVSVQEPPEPAATPSPEQAVVAKVAEPEIITTPVTRPPVTPRISAPRVLRPPIKPAAAPTPPVQAAPPPPAPPAPVVEPEIVPVKESPPAVAAPPTRVPEPPRVASFGSRPSLVSGSPAAGTVPPGTIIRAPGTVPGISVGPRPAAGGKPIYQPRRSPAAPGGADRPGSPRPGMPPRPGMTPRPGAPARSGMSAGAGAAAAGRPYERRPMHPTRTRPASAGGVLPPAAGALPPPGPSRHRPRPGGQAQARDRERGQRRMAPPVREPAVIAGPREINRTITITEGLTVKDLAEKLGEKAKDLMQMLIRRGILATINQPLESSVANELARHFGAESSVVSFEEQSQAEVAVAEAEDPAQLVKRPPVVTIMGHVDHGKTSLLDAIRETNVTGGEAGGITQHIGAYKVETGGRQISFIDTPGHEAFTRMRARGSKVTDIVVLVVAADDGVMPQTLEAIDHARAAKVPIIVAINKIDKAEALPERVKKQLGDRGLMAEDWGGDTVMVEVSAKKKKNLDLLLEMILLTADLQDLKANPSRPAAGTVLEAKLDRGRGPVATVLVQNGTLRVGDPFIVGPVFSKVRALMDDRGNTVESAGPACPVEVLGLASLPQAGDQFQVIRDVLKAKQTAMYRELKLREQQMASSTRLTLEQLHEQMKSGVVKELPIILKADVRGSAEVLSEALGKIADERVKVKIIHAGVGAITESDVLLAAASNAIIIGFSVRPDRKAIETAAQEKVDIRLHTIIYNVTDEVKKAMSGLLEPSTREVSLGRAEVRETFRISKVGAVAGCLVQEGILKRAASVRLVRDGAVVHTGKIGSLRRFKDDASEVKSGFECGVSLENYADVKPGDIIEAFVIERVQGAAIQ